MSFFDSFKELALTALANNSSRWIAFILISGFLTFLVKKRNSNLASNKPLSLQIYLDAFEVIYWSFWWSIASVAIVLSGILSGLTPLNPLVILNLVGLFALGFSTVHLGFSQFKQIGKGVSQTVEIIQERINKGKFWFLQYIDAIKADINEKECCAAIIKILVLLFMIGLFLVALYLMYGTFLTLKLNIPSFIVLIACLATLIAIVKSTLSKEWYWLTLLILFLGFIVALLISLSLT